MGFRSLAVVTLNAQYVETNELMAGASESAEGAAFARTLTALKERGSNLLVVGTTYERGHAAVCERLLGEADIDRRRLLVRTDGECGATPEDDDTLRLVVQRTPGIAPPEESEGVPERAVALGDVDELERATIEGLTALEEAAADPEPGALRLCVDSLRPLLVQHPEGRVRRFVETLGTRVARADGMGHFHLPTRSTDRYVSMLTPEVDAVVEVRTHDGDLQQRWHVFEGAVDSGWLTL